MELSESPITHTDEATLARIIVDFALRHRELFGKLVVDADLGNRIMPVHVYEYAQRVLAETSY